MEIIMKIKIIMKMITILKIFKSIFKNKLMEFNKNENDNGDYITDDVMQTDIEKDTIAFVSNPINKIKKITKSSLEKKFFSKWTEEETIAIFGTYAYFKSYAKILKCSLVFNELKPEHQCAYKIRRRIQDVDKKILKNFDIIKNKKK
jgi:hypothetical protein